MTLRYKTWLKKYKPLMDEYWQEYGFTDIAKSFDTHGDDIDFLNKQNPLCIWTQIDVGTKRQRIVSGARLVNRVAYYVTEVPFEEGEYIEVFAQF